MLFITITGCKVGPDYTPIETTIPDVWHETLLQGNTASSQSVHTWWQQLNDPILNQLIAQADDQNLNLKEAIERIAASRARRGITAGAAIPTLDSRGSYQRTDKNFFSPYDDGKEANINDLSIDCSWEIDLFGRIARSVESADASLQATIEDYRDVKVSLYSEVAINYIQYRTLQQRMVYANNNITTQKAAVKLTRDRLKAGVSGDLDVAQAETNLSRSKAFIPDLTQNKMRVLNRLCTLLGKHPGTLYPLINKGDAMPAVAAEMTSGLATNLIRQRPDIRKAERRIASQSAQIGVATSELYPRFSLSGTFAITSDGISGDSADATAWGPLFSWNLFNGSRTKNNIKQQEAILAQYIYQYEHLILSALEQSQNNITAFNSENQKHETLTHSVASAKRTESLVQTLYTTGLTSFLNVLEAQRTSFTVQDELAQSEGKIIINLIELYRSLGGGWDYRTDAAQ